MARPALGLPPQFVECLTACADRCAPMPTARRCFRLVKRCARLGLDATCSTSRAGDTTTTTSPAGSSTTTTSSTTLATLAVPMAYRGTWRMEAESYDVTPDEHFCDPQETAVPFGIGVNVSETSISVQWSSRPSITANLDTQDGGVWHFLALRSDPAYSETTDYALAFESSTPYAIAVVTRTRDYFYRQCVVHWYGSMAR
jgi:hypothetical protein